MLKFETTDPTEALRCKRAQFQVRISTLVLAGSTVTGLVRAVAVAKDSLPAKWIVTVDPKGSPPECALRKKLK